MVGPPGSSPTPGRRRFGLDGDELRQGVDVEGVGAKAAGDAEDVQGQDGALRDDDAETRAGGEEVALGVAEFHGQASPLGVLEEGGEVENLVAGTPGVLGGRGQGKVAVGVCGDDGLDGLDEVDDGAEVAGGLRRGIGRDLRLFAVR